MKVYDIVLEKKINAAGGIADKVIHPDGSIEVLLDMGNNNTEVLKFKDQKALDAELKKTKDIIKTKVGKFNFVKKLTSFKLWGPAAALQIAESLYDIIDQSDEKTTRETIQKEIASVVPVVVTALVVSGLKSGKMLPWIKKAMDAKKATKLATAALTAAGIATGGTSWIAAAISGATWLALEIAIWLAVEYLAEYFIDEYILDDPLDEEVRNELTAEIAKAIGLSIAGHPEKLDQPISHINQDDIEKIRNIDPDVYNSIVNKPEYEPATRDYRSRRNDGRASTGSITQFQKFQTDSIKYESTESKTPNPAEFIKHLEKRGYNNTTIKKVSKFIRKHS
jgi:hypothetical protein